MGKPQETMQKKELEKKRAQKKKEKEQRKEERKANAKSGQSWESMMAYIDENGNITSTPPDPLKKRDIKVDDIVIGSRNLESHASPTIKTGTVTFFNASKGFGFIKDAQSGESIFVHTSALLSPVKENDKVTFETEMTHKGYSALRVKTIR
jgi:cold shock CspA family protein